MILEARLKAQWLLREDPQNVLHGLLEIDGHHLRAAAQRCRGRLIRKPLDLESLATSRGTEPSHMIVDNSSSM